jgi:sugar lactone lactonase YvrE
LRDLEAKFPEHLAVIGVHSAKYTTERRDVHLAQAVRRLGIHHPVVNDGEMRLWSEYAVRAWPTLMFVGPDGRVIGKHEGEFDPDAMEVAVHQIIEEASAARALSGASLDLIAEPEPLATTLAFPTAVQVSGERLFIADTMHHRIVIATLDGEIEQLIGSGEMGFLDGGANEASFHAPHGLDVYDGWIYVADTENHAIRAVELKTGQVSTIAGTGGIARSYGSGGSALETSLRSPWDVTVVDGTLYIAMAGNHQLWMHRLGSDEVRRFAGTGHEGKRDDRVPRAWLAQPSGVGPLRDGLVFADAETSSVRTSSLTTDGEVVTLVGKDLFDWGDVDGSLSGALLQHTTGVAWEPDSDLIYVSDTYNNKVKRIDLAERRITTLAGTGDPAHADGPADVAAFFEPHGLAVANGFLYVADTDNHAIRAVHLTTGVVSTIQVV